MIHNKKVNVIMKYFKCHVLLITIGILASGASLQAQDFEFTKPSWWIGGAGAANLNDYRGTTQRLTSQLKIPTAFHHGKGVGLYLAPLVEFHRPNARWGAMLQVGYDNRGGSFEQIITPCNCPANLSTNLSYLTVEPSVRYAPFKSGLYLFGGPRFAYNVTNSFIFKQKPNPDFPEQQPIPDVKDNFSNTNKTVLSMQIGAGFDIPVSTSSYEQTVLSPFISFQPYFGQAPRSSETSSLTTLRVGVALKFGRGQKILIPVETVNFYVNSPANIAVVRGSSETFPLSNYIFFNEGSTQIPDRYSLLNKKPENNSFNTQPEVLATNQLSDRSMHEMKVYYNILNILGDRMKENSSSVITLVGSSRNGEEEGIKMAESIKQYLANIFEIDPTRINIEGRDKPKIPSEKRSGKYQLDVLREGDDRRVSVESDTPALLMEYKNSSDTSHLSSEMSEVPPLNSYVSFHIEGAKEVLVSWSLQVMNENNETQNFGPYTLEETSLPGKSILGGRPEGDYKMKMIGQTKKGKVITRETAVHVVGWSPPKEEAAGRYNVLFEFNDFKVIPMYEKYLSEIVTPLIPVGATVVIRGHTDIIGEENHNLILSMDRANEVMSILEGSLRNAGRSDVTFEVYGHGEDQNRSPFQNIFPEERFYNRTVTIDILRKE